MELQPVRKYTLENYPTKAEINASPELLRVVPRRWQRSSAIGTLLAGLGLFAAPQPAFTAPEAAPVVSRIAPLFPYQKIHENAQIMGKIAIPLFLSEEDARMIILEEAAKAGISFTPDARIFEQVPFPTTQQDEAGNVTTTIVKKFPVTLDGTDATRNISYEFISKADMDEWAKEKINITTLGNPAATLRDGMTQGVPAGTYAVFYDPADMVFRGGVDLRTQVRQFIAWLKAEGVI